MNIVLRTLLSIVTQDARPAGMVWCGMRGVVGFMLWYSMLWYGVV